jgi:hypothetical protein
MIIWYLNTSQFDKHVIGYSIFPFISTVHAHNSTSKQLLCFAYRWDDSEMGWIGLFRNLEMFFSVEQG